MDTVTISKIAKMSDEQRIAWARRYTGDQAMTAEDVSGILDAARDGNPAPEPVRLLALIFDDQQDGEVRERALLALYYHIEAVRNSSDRDDESITVLERISDQLARSPRDEGDEKVRGTTCWIKIRRMIDTETPSEIVVDTVQRLCRDESSSYVLDRIAASVSDDRSTLFALFPLDGTWSPPDTDGWNRLERTAIQQTHKAGQILGAVRRRASDALSAVARGDNGFRRYVETLDAAAREYIVPPPVVSETVKMLSPPGRNRVLAVCSGGSTREDTPRLSRYLADFIEITKPTTGEPDWADELTMLGLQATIANVGRGVTDAPFNLLVEPALQLLSKPIPDQYDCSATRHSLYKLAGGILRVVFTDQGETAAIMERVGRSELDLVTLLTEALAAESPYIVNVAADVALLLSRNNALPPELVAPLLERLSQFPATDGGMCSGHDLNDDDITVPDGVELVYTSDETGSPHDADAAASDSGGQDEFFTVSGLTGLLEGCREPFCAWRIAAALSAHADTHRDTQLVAQLRAYADENEVIAEWEPLVDNSDGPARSAAKADGDAAVDIQADSTDAEQDGFATSGKVHTNQPGPYTLQEIIHTLAHIADIPKSEWPELQEDIAREREHQLKTMVSRSQRNRIKEVFEGLPESGKSDISPLVPIATQTLQRGFTSFVPHQSFVPGTLDDQELMSDRNDNLEPINSTETLAYYVARECLPAARSHQWGIYFRVKPLAALNRAVPGNLRALIEPVAVHELVHHHTAIRTRELHLHRTCGTFRRLEEATADWNAVQRLTQMLNDEALTTSRYQEIMRLVFPRRENGGLPGYGDWPLMDTDAAPLAPYFDSQAWDHPAPPYYRTRKQLLIIATHPPEITPIDLPREHRLWASVLEAIGTGEVPMYLDFQ